MRQVGRIALALPLAQREGHSPGDMYLYGAHNAAARLLIFLCEAAADALADPCEAAAAAAAAGVAAAAGDPAAMAPGSRWAAAVAAERKELRLAVLQLVPRAAALLRALAAGGCCTKVEVVDAVESYAQFFLFCGNWLPDAASAADKEAERHDAAAVWAAPLSALPPLLLTSLQRHTDWQRLGCGAAIRLPSALERLWVYGASAVLTAAHRPTAGASAKQAAERLAQIWTVHSAGCRVLHWLAQQEQQEGSVCGPNSERIVTRISSLLDGLHMLLTSVWLLLSPLTDGCNDAANGWVHPDWLWSPIFPAAHQTLQGCSVTQAPAVIAAHAALHFQRVCTHLASACARAPPPPPRGPPPPARRPKDPPHIHHFIPPHPISLLQQQRRRSRHVCCALGGCAGRTAAGARWRLAHHALPGAYPRGQHPPRHGR